MHRILVGFVILSTVFVAGQTDGQTDDKKLEHLRKYKPNELEVSYNQVPECTISKEAVELMIDGVLTRSRIKRVENSIYMSLRIAAHCFENETAFTLDVRFGEYVSVYKPQGEEVFFMFHSGQYGSFGVHLAKSDFLMRSIKESVEKAITDYMKANFDL